LRSGLDEATLTLGFSSTREVSKTVGLMTHSRPESGRLHLARPKRRVLTHSEVRQKTCPGLLVIGQPRRVSQPERGVLAAVSKLGGFLTCLTRHGYLGLSVACQRSHAAQRAEVCRTNVTSLRRKPFKQKGLATLSQQCHQSTQGSPVYRVDYLSFQGHRPGRDSVRECSECMKRQHC